jgi:hypothetical protein
VFILTASRSGSTLLRFILDSHPDLACPPETSVTAACVQFARTWDIVENAGADDSSPVDDQREPSAEALAAVRDAVDRMYGRYLHRRGKRRWCDKSLDTHLHAELMLMLYPDAKFICLYRHCMDVVASGVETCPWGLHRFGFDPYVAQNPGNSVAAIGSYWLATAQSLLAFEEQHPRNSLRVRYEDLVTAPEETTARIFSFLGAAQVPGITQACFQAPHEGNGPGDEKVWFTGEVNADSIGRGAGVPAAGLVPQLRQPINEALGRLEYRQIDDEWNASAGRVDPRADAAPRQAPGHGEQGAAREEAAAAARIIGDRITLRPDSELREISMRWPALAERTLSLVVEDPGGEHEEIRWTIPPVPGQSEPVARPADDGGNPVATVIASPATWRSLLDGETNVVTEMTSGRLRCVNRRDAYRIRSAEMHAVAALLGLTQVPVARDGNGRCQPATDDAAEAVPEPV